MTRKKNEDGRTKKKVRIDYGTTTHIKRLDGKQTDPRDTTDLFTSYTSTTIPDRTRIVDSVCKSGLVRFFGPKLKDQDRDRSSFVLELKKTGPDR